MQLNTIGMQLEMNLYPREDIKSILYTPTNKINFNIKSNSIDKVSIYQRRYLGNKYNALSLIDYVIKSKVKSFSSFCDIFAGTGGVGYFYNQLGNSIISNDLLYVNYIAIKAFLDDSFYDLNIIKELIKYFNELEIDEDNYFSIHFGDKYFSMVNAKKIGYIREEIEKLYIQKSINRRERAILITSLVYAMDKIANTVGHYDAFLQKKIIDKKLELKILDIDNKANKNNKIFNEDANNLIKNIQGDVLYIDPPYNSRQYSDTYHLLENVARWEKPKVSGVANKFDRTHLKSRYSLKEAPKAFRELIENANFKYILFSYNNMQSKGNSRSNARISDEEIFDILSLRGEVEVFEQEYKEFNTGKKKREDNKERVFFVKVEK